MPRANLIVLDQSRVTEVIKKAELSIAQNTDSSSFYSRGLAREGYLGGYVAALIDIQAILAGNEPASKFWRDV